MEKSSFKREFSAGGVVFRREKGETMWLIGKHSGYHKWVLPKGLIEKGERGFETATREVEEEMGIRARLVSEKPIHRVQYVYWADLKDKQRTENREQKTEDKVRRSGDYYQQSDEVKARRRVEKYQEEFTASASAKATADKSEGKRTKVFKVVSFYLLEYKSGDVADHDWEMEDAVWLPYKEAMDRLAFEGEREALRQAQDKTLR